MQIIIEPSTRVMRLTSIPRAAMAPKTQSVDITHEVRGIKTPKIEPVINHIVSAATATATGISRTRSPTMV